MKKYKVTFLPAHKVFEVDEGITLFDAAEMAGVHINNLCGGQGICGECRVQIVKGKAQANEYAIGFLSKEELQQGFVLACQTKVEDDLEVLVPQESRLEQEQILTEGVAVAYSAPEKISLLRVSHDPAQLVGPLVSKFYLELPPPTLSDNIPDVDRITRELLRKSGFSSFEISLPCLQNIAHVIRQSDWKVTVSVARGNGVGRILQVESGDTSERNYGLAIDIGTTTVVVQLVNLQTGRVIGVEASHNQQAHYGEDVISRMVFACTRGALDSLHKAVIDNINGLTQALCNEKGIRPQDITCIVTAGNTTMTHFFLRLDPCNIRLEPYVPTTTINPQVRARDIGININPEAVVEALPSVASYIGGDTVAGVLACGLAERPEVTCLIDVGTNGEIVIGNNDWMVTCSASAGPAFEGGGIRMGMRATRGAIEKMRIDNGKVIYETVGKAKARGICGSGLIDIIQELRKHNIIGPDGKFNVSLDDKRIVVEEGEPQYKVALPEETENGRAVVITESDISNIIKSKGAIFAAIKSLADYVGMTFEQLHTIYIAGGFGNSLNIPKAIAIGLLPDVDVKKVQFIGNSSVMGARMALLSGPAFHAALNIARKMTNIELSNYTPFMNEFIAALFLPHTDSRLFPSVHY
ncbi:MAG: DUF4445 domain-containing protein [Chloroflexi bacterium]|nr:DUF4445 domain-containing protein [Chloroflexota bacterium]